MSIFLNQVFLALTPASVTEAFLVLMLAIFVGALIFRFAGRARDFVDQAPGFLTSLGILGTFIGIIIGLYEFSLEEIDRSIADLMAGLKTAFITSVIGLALSLLLRVFTRMVRLPSDPGRESATIDDLNHNLLQLQGALNNFSAHASEQLVSRLEKVVADFNLHLGSQFGENLQGFCRQLANLEPALSTAAAEYRAHSERVASWSKLCDESQQSLADQQAALSQMYDRIAALPHLYRGLDQLLERQGEQAEQMGRILAHQHQSVQQLAELAPQLPRNLERLTQGVAAAQQGVEENLAAINQLLQGHAQSLSGQFQSLSGALNNLKALDPEAIQQLVSASAQSHRDSMRDLAQLMASTHREMSHALTEVIGKELKDADISIRRQYEQMDRVMAGQVEQVLAAMGESLATISGNFTRDYKQLLVQMRRVKTQAVDYAE